MSESPRVPPTVEESLHTTLAAFTSTTDGATHLVALDFDGTLSPLVDDPKAATMAPAARAAVQRLAGLADATRTRLAFVSGRALDDLAARTEAPAGAYLIGSHGAEFGRMTGDGVDAVPLELTPEQADDLAELVAALEAAAEGCEGAWVQTKPSAAVLHTRLAAPDDAEPAIAAADAAAERLGLHAMHGKDVVEIAVVPTSKGAAIGRLRTVVGQDTGSDDVRVLYAGDDTTDERAFEVLDEGDVAVKVGAGDTVAPYRVADADELAHVLELVADALSVPDRTGTGDTVL